LINSYWRFN